VTRVPYAATLEGLRPPGAVARPPSPCGALGLTARRLPSGTRVRRFVSRCKLRPSAWCGPLGVRHRRHGRPCASRRPPARRHHWRFAGSGHSEPPGSWAIRDPPSRRRPPAREGRMRISRPVATGDAVIFACAGSPGDRRRPFAKPSGALNLGRWLTVAGPPKARRATKASLAIGGSHPPSVPCCRTQAHEMATRGRKSWPRNNFGSYEGHKRRAESVNTMPALDPIRKESCCIVSGVRVEPEAPSPRSNGVLVSWCHQATEAP